MKWPWNGLLGRRNIVPGTSRQPADRSFFSALSRDEIARLDQQRSLIAAELNRRYGIVSLAGSDRDLAPLQRLLDDHVFTGSQTYELQCLGVAFGDVLASQLPLHWVIITDEYGSDPTLRLGDTSININALTMISKRVEKGEPVDLSKLLEQTRAAVSRAEKHL